ncbi:beta-lactamase/transpeptidase-like protein [Mycena galopus ATCC 62051]|nr:beta-lactamase/transpeptidase-like protein [Mycena galopus ATCC 62051]
MTSPALSPVAKDALDRILSDAVASKSTPAMFLGATSVDGPIYMRTVGRKLVDDLASPAIDEDTVFALFSQTKLITTIAALQLIDQGKIALDTPVEAVLPELVDPVVVTAQDETGRATATEPAKTKITLGHLLNHTSGLDYFINGVIQPDAVPAVYKHHYKDDEDISTFFKILKGSHSGVPLRFEPGTSWVYGFSTDCVGFIVERLSGKSLEQYFQDHIFAPLGITSISFCLTPPLKDRLLPLSYRTNGKVEAWNGRPPVFDRNPAKVQVPLGGVGLYGSQKDYLVLLRHLLQIKANCASTPILSRASVETIFTPSLLPAGVAALNEFVGFVHPYLGLPAGAAQFSYGLCLNTTDVPGKRSSGSGCWSGMALTSYFLDPAVGVAMIFATQILPAADDTHERLYDIVEKELYGGLGLGTTKL